MLFADKERENEVLRQRLDALQTQQTMMLAYVLREMKGP